MYVHIYIYVCISRHSPTAEVVEGVLEALETRLLNEALPQRLLRGSEVYIINIHIHIYIYISIHMYLYICIST